MILGCGNRYFRGLVLHVLGHVCDARRPLFAVCGCTCCKCLSHLGWLGGTVAISDRNCFSHVFSQKLIERCLGCMYSF